MAFSESEVDRIVYDVLLDCRSVTPPLDRNEIAQHVASHFSPRIHRQVCAALERLVRQGLVSDDRDAASGHPVRYWLPQDYSPQH